MRLRRIRLTELAESDRARFLLVFVGRVDQALSHQFPAASGYKHASGWQLAPCTSPKEKSAGIQNGCSMASLQISRGRFWGLYVRVQPEDEALKSLKVTIDGYFPIVERFVETLERLFNLPGQNLLGRIVRGHLVLPLLIIPLMFLLPFLALYRLAKLRMRADILAADRILDSMWPEIQASWPVVVRMSRPISPSLIYFFATAGGSGVTFACFWAAGLSSTSESWRVGLYVVGGILALVSVVMLIALVMTVLGFERDS